MDIVVPGADVLGECPLWSPAEARLYWIDIEGRAVHRFDPSTGDDEVRSLEVRPGSMALTQTPGRMVMGAENQVGWFDWDRGTFAAFGDLEPAGTGNRLNDGRTDRQGRFWLGSMHERPAERHFTGRLHRVDADLTHATVRTEIGVTNGIAFSPEGTTMYFADTLRSTIWRYDHDIATGVGSNERVFTDFTGLPGGPDGATVDEEGCYWIACVHGAAVARLTPAGAVDRIIELPMRNPTMPAFGGAGLDTLFVTSLTAGESPADDPHAGAMVAIDPGVRGIAESPFAG